MQQQLQEQEARCSALEASRDQISGSWEFSAAQLETAEQEIEECRAAIDELNRLVAAREAEIDDANAAVAQLEDAVVLLLSEDLQRSTSFSISNSSSDIGGTPAQYSSQQVQLRTPMIAVCSAALLNAEQRQAARQQHGAARQYQWDHLRSSLHAHLQLMAQSQPQPQPLPFPSSSVTAATASAATSEASRLLLEQADAFVGALLADLAQRDAEIDQRNNALQRHLEELARQHQLQQQYHHPQHPQNTQHPQLMQLPPPPQHQHG